jgi:hypothetical protein
VASSVITVASARLLPAFDPTDVGFVGFDNAATAAHRLQTDYAHGFAETMRHKPRGLEGDAQGPVELMGSL